MCRVQRDGEGVEVGEKKPNTERDRRDRDTLADPDVRGVRQGRLGRGQDPRFPNGNTPEKVERAWRREGRG